MNQETSNVEAGGGLDDWLLLVEIKSDATDAMKDWVTAKVSKLMRETPVDENTRLRGPVICPKCGLYGGGDNAIRILSNGLQLPPIALHAVERHRADVPQTEITKLVTLMGVKSSNDGTQRPGTRGMGQDNQKLARPETWCGKCAQR